MTAEEEEKKRDENRGEERNRNSDYYRSRGRQHDGSMSTEGRRWKEGEERREGRQTYNRHRVADHVKNPSKYKKYDLSDVQEGGRATNSAAAFAFLAELRDRKERERRAKEGRDGSDEEDADLSKPIAFRPRSKGKGGEVGRSSASEKKTNSGSARTQGGESYRNASSNLSGATHLPKQAFPVDIKDSKVVILEKKGGKEEGKVPKWRQYVDSDEDEGQDPLTQGKVSKHVSSKNRSLGEDKRKQSEGIPGTTFNKKQRGMPRQDRRKEAQSSSKSQMEQRGTVQKPEGQQTGVNRREQAMKYGDKRKLGGELEKEGEEEVDLLLRDVDEEESDDGIE
mmetsp:Transcript_46699/g.120396  ORF Transcript_46699/g.120396 Transcript_46699/m.120396 type:complete len:338 (-) Transcript_46699:96-1109(-)